MNMQEGNWFINLSKSVVCQCPLGFVKMYGNNITMMIFVNSFFNNIFE